MNLDEGEKKNCFGILTDKQPSGEKPLIILVVCKCSRE